MRYKTAYEIYEEEVKNKGLHIPRLSFKDEANFRIMNITITELAAFLNFHSNFQQFFMFSFKRKYKNQVKEMKEFMEFWAFQDGKDIKIQNFYGEA